MALAPGARTGERDCETALFAAVSPAKDVDGFHPVNVAKVALGDPDAFAAQDIDPAAVRPQPNERLTVPLVREAGVLRPASWDEALDRAAAGFRSVVDRLGPDAVGMFSCSKATNEVNYLAQKFTRQVMGCNNVDSCNRT